MKTCINNKYVLVLPGWYPSRVDRFNGDFNERLVKAVSLSCKQVVLYVVKDPATDTVQTEIIEDHNIITYRVYYPSHENGFARKISAAWRYLGLYRKFISEIVTLYGKPALVHCYVFYPAMFAALAVSKRYKLPLVLTEHWTAFYKANPGSLFKYYWPMRMLFKYLLRSATHIIPIAHRLGAEIQNWANSVPQTIIPNVVDVSAFNYSAKLKHDGNFIFLHISTMKYQKNTDGLLRSFDQAIKKGINAKLHLAGPVPESISTQIKASQNLRENAHLHGEVDYREVAEIMEKNLIAC